MAVVTEESVDTGGLRSHVLRAGAGNEKAVVLIHGGGPGADADANFRSTMELLGERFDVFAPDLAGFGSTERPPEGTVTERASWMEIHVRQVVGLLDKYGRAAATLVGNSLGGAVSLATTLEHPERVESLVLMGSAGAPVEPGPALKAMLAFYTDPTEERLRSILRSFVYDVDQFGDLDSLVEMRHAAAVKPEVQASFEALNRPQDGQGLRDLDVFRERLSGISQPALVVHGRQDEIIPIEGSYWLADSLPDSDLLILGRCGHWVMLERRQAFIQAVAGFIDERLGGELRLAS